MKSKTILILGGSGGAGYPMARLLLEKTDTHIIISARHEERAQKIINELKKDFPAKRVSFRMADVYDSKSMAKAFQGVDLVIDSVLTTDRAGAVGLETIKAKADYFDVHFPLRHLRQLQKIENQIKTAGRCFITQGGFHPGLPAIFVRHAAKYFSDKGSSYQKAFVAMAIRSNHFGSPDSILELIDEMGDFSAEVYKEGKWQKSSSGDIQKFDFGKGFGRQMCFPITMEEMKILPKLYNLKQTGVYVAGLGWFIDFFVFPLIMLFGKIKRGLGRKVFARLMLLGGKFSRPPYGVVFKLEAEGLIKGKQSKVTITSSHSDGYIFTAIPAVACLLQYLDGSINKPGLHLMGHISETERLFKDMKEMGIKISESCS